MKKIYIVLRVNSIMNLKTLKHYTFMIKHYLFLVFALSLVVGMKKKIGFWFN